jgi:hypothetical protein
MASNRVGAVARPIRRVDSNVKQIMRHSPWPVRMVSGTAARMQACTGPVDGALNGSPAAPV